MNLLRKIKQSLKIRLYEIIILHVVRYGCETWSLTLRKEHRLRVFENRVLRRILGLKSDEVTTRERKLHNEEHPHFSFSFRQCESLPMRGRGGS
jgi:hypothetical protein